MIELSENECLQIVRKATMREDLKIKRISSEHFGDFLGFLGEYYRLNIATILNDSETKEYQFFVKSLPIIDMRSRRDMLIETGIFHKEMKIYQKLLIKFVELTKDEGDDEIWCPTIYLIRDDLIVFNDLTLQGYKVLPFSPFDFTQQQVETTLKSLVNFHACSMIFERKENICIGDEFSDILFETSVSDNPWFMSGVELIKKVAETEFDVKDSENIKDKIFSVVATMEKSPFDVPKVLCHRDLWKNNLMFRENPPNCVLIDFQTARYIALSVDVVMAVICTTRRAHYEKLMGHYLQFYYQCLEVKLSKYLIDLRVIMDYENFVKSCKYHEKLLILYKSYVVTLTQMPQELFKNFNENDYLEFASGDRYSLIKRFMEQDLAFKDRVIESIEAVLEIL